MIGGYWSLDYDDRYQEAMLGLVIAADRFDPDRGYFAPFARSVIRNRLNTMYHKSPRHEDIAETDRIKSSDEEYLVMKLDIERVIESLDQNSRLVARLMIRGRKQGEIAEHIGVSQPTVSRMIFRIREQVKEVL